MYDVYGDAVMIVISYMSVAKRRMENFGRKGTYTLYYAMLRHISTNLYN